MNENGSLVSSPKQRDSRRGNYSLKETMLAKRMGVACGLAETSPDVDAVVNWRTRAAGPLPGAAGGGGRRGGGSSKAMLTGNFVAVLHAVRIVANLITKCQMHCRWTPNIIITLPPCAAPVCEALPSRGGGSQHGLHPDRRQGKRDA